MVRIMHTTHKNKGPLIIDSDTGLLLSDSTPPSPTHEARRILQDDILQGDGSATITQMKTGRKATQRMDAEETGSAAKKRKQYAPLEVKSVKINGKYISMEGEASHEPKGTFKGKTKVVAADDIDDLLIESEDDFYLPDLDLASRPRPAQDTISKFLTQFAKEQRITTAAHRKMTHFMQKELRQIEHNLKISEHRLSILETKLRAHTSSSSLFPSFSSEQELGETDSD